MRDVCHLRVYRIHSFIDDEEGGLRDERAQHADDLALARGKLPRIFTEQRVETGREARDEGLEAECRDALEKSRALVACTPQHDVVAQREVEDLRRLAHDSHV